MSDQPGFDALDDALAATYPDLAGVWAEVDDPERHTLRAIRVFTLADPRPHWLYVTYGLTELDAKESTDLETSGFGFELTIRVERPRIHEADAVETWPLDLLQQLSAYVAEHASFDVGHHFDLGEPLFEGSILEGIVFTADSRVPAELASENGRFKVLQCALISADELEVLRRWSSEPFVKLLKDHQPDFIVDPYRKSVLEAPDVRAAAELGIAREGSSFGVGIVQRLGWIRRKPKVGPTAVDVDIGESAIGQLIVGLSARVGHGLAFILRKDCEEIAGRMVRAQTIVFEPGNEAGWRVEEEMEGDQEDPVPTPTLVLTLPPPLAARISQELKRGPGRYAWAELEGVTVDIVLE